MIARNENNVLLLVFGVMSIAILFAILLVINVFSVEPQATAQKKAVQHDTMALETGVPIDSQNTLEQSTGILGQTVYDANNQVIGTLYDAYIDPKDGKILWTSVNVSGLPNSDLVLLQISEMDYLTQSGTDPIIATRINKDDFMNRPRQQEFESNIAGLISLRDLAGADLVDSQNNVIGKITKITYQNNAPDQIYFAVKKDQATVYEDEAQIFTLPFEYIIFTDIDGVYGDTKALLTERQAGAIEAYLKSNPR